MCLIYNEKWKMTNDGRNRTATSRKYQKGGKETYKYLEILEADTIKQAEMKEKI